MSIKIYFGALCEPVAEQLGINEHIAEPWQKDADAITRLVVRGLLTDSETHRARKRLIKMMGAAL